MCTLYLGSVSRGAPCVSFLFLFFIFPPLLSSPFLTTDPELVHSRKRCSGHCTGRTDLAYLTFLFPRSSHMPTFTHVTQTPLTVLNLIFPSHVLPDSAHSWSPQLILSLTLSPGPRSPLHALPCGPYLLIFLLQIPRILSPQALRTRPCLLCCRQAHC